MKKNPLLILLFLTMNYELFTLNYLYASAVGTTAGIIMMQPVGVRQMALGGCGTSLDEDIYTLYFNPAGLASISRKQISSFFTSGLSDDYKASVIYNQPLLTRKRSSIAFGVLHLNGGKIEINYIDGTSKSAVSQSDFMATIGWGWYLSEDFSMGYNIKCLSTRLVEEYNASAAALDTGMLLRSKNKRLHFGLSVQNYGTSIKYRSKGESLPFLVRSGLSYNLPISNNNSLLAVADSFDLIKEEGIYSSVGLEYSLYERYFLRGGLKILPDRNNYTLGLGFRFYDRFSVDFATELNSISNPYQVSFLMRFGGEESEQENEESRLKKVQEAMIKQKFRSKKSKLEEQKINELQKGNIINIAVANFEGNNVSQSDASIVDDFLRIELEKLSTLIKPGTYNLIGKADMDKILAEAAFQRLGCATPDCAVQIGKILNAQQIIIGNLSKLIDTYLITVNLVDVETGSILKSENVKAYSAEELNDACKILANLILFSK
ncbi:MAG: PorV/PorQ family protein [Elusimicrobia bacterium]|nr:PorV/PorQ family protein [Elusimicrobiota bacterium]